MNILGLYQGSGYILEFPVTVDGVVLAAADAIQFDMYAAGVLTHTATSCGGGDVSLASGIVSVALSSAVTVNFNRAYKYELWFIPAGSNEKHIITTGTIQFIKTITRIEPCL